jgi:hypothetical protein
MSKQLFHEIEKALNKHHDTTIGQMFGKPCIKIGSKTIVVLINDEMVFKIGKRYIEQCKKRYPESFNWDPTGLNRPMKDWLQVPPKYSDHWMNLAEKALEFIEKNQ